MIDASLIEASHLDLGFLRNSEAYEIRILRKENLLIIGISYLLFSCCVISAFALASDRTIAQYVHTAWTPKEGAPSGILALTQTTDGFLWVGSVDGLYRFDGVSFEQRQTGVIYALLAMPNGDLWIGRKSEVCLLRSGEMRCYAAKDGVPDGKVASFAEDGEGTMWVSTNVGLARLEGNRWKRVGPDWNFNEPYATGMVLDRRGTFWVAAGHTILYLPPGSRRFETAGIATTQVWTLVEAPNGKLWMSETSRSVRPIPIGRDLPPSDKTEFMVGSICFLFDREGALWIGDIGHGMRRVPFPERVDGRKFEQRDAVMESFTAADGLTDNVVTAIAEDREGNIWVGTNNGLDRFYRSLLVPIVVPFPLIQPVMAPGDAGSVWVSPFDHKILVRPPDKIKVLPPGEQYFGAYRAPDGALWWTAAGVLDRLGPGAADWSRPLRISGPGDHKWKTGQALQVTEDRYGVIWAATQDHGAFFLKNGQWHALEGVSVSAGYAGHVAFTDSAGRVWLGFEDGTLVQIEDGRLKRSWSGRDSPVGHYVGAIAGSVRHVWLGGDKLVYFDGENFHEVVPIDGPPFKVWGIEEVQDGGLWLCENRGVIHIPSEEVGKLLENYAYRVRYELYDSLDGLPGSFHDAASRSREIQGTDGRIWFSATKGIAWLNPASISRNAVPPPVTVRLLKAGGKEYPAERVTLPPLATALEIDYTALSLSIPERVRFRYRLEGIDKDWENAGTRREAFYTGLGPGKYRFRVIACNNDGIWNNAGATLVFSIAPAWHQTLWFKALCWLTFLLLICLAYRFRVRQIASAINVRFNERLTERTRMARELHDTFLQTVQGSRMVVEDALSPGTDEARMRQALQKLSTWLTQAVDEGREALNALRTSTTEKNHLSEALQRAAEDPQIPRSMNASLSVFGDVRDLHPIVRDEIYHVAFEAIRNAVLHSRASLLQIEIRYTNDLMVIVRDDGIGIDPSLLGRGKTGHFGLQGMRERAAQIHGKLSIRSSVDCGTEVLLSVPGQVSYRDNHPTSIHKLKEQVKRIFHSSFDDRS